jgi:peptidoglycan biosynthesis protein MviN/MurJ (putative lipid II flippase)
VGLLLTAIQFLGHDGLAAILAPGFPVAQRHELSAFLVLTSPVAALAAVTAAAQAVCYYERSFAAAAAAPVLNGCALLAVTAGGAPNPSAAWLAFATSVGYLVQAVWLFPFLRKLLLLSDEQATGPGDGRAFGASFVALAASSLVYKAQPVVERLVGSTVGPGVTASLGYAMKIAQGLVLLATLSVTVVALPALSQAVAERHHVRTARILARSLAATTISTLLVVAAAAAVWRDVPRLLYGRQEFGLVAERQTAQLLLAYLPWILFSTLAGPLTSAAYATGHARFVARVGIIGFVLASLSSFAASRAFGAAGIVLGSAVGSLLCLLVFAMNVKRWVATWSWTSWFKGMRAPVSGLVSAGSVAYFTIDRLLGVPAPRSQPWHQILEILGKEAILCVFLGAALLCSRRALTDLLQS